MGAVYKKSVREREKDEKEEELSEGEERLLEKFEYRLLCFFWQQWRNIFVG